MTDVAWRACLDRLAQHLAAQRRAIGCGDVASLQAFVPESGLGPLPASLRDRARRLESECAALVDELAEARARTAHQLEALAHPHHDAAPSYVDSRA